MGVIDRAVVALKNFVGELARGGRTCRCASTRSTATCRVCSAGQTISEKDLFFPDVSLRRAGASGRQGGAGGRAAGLSAGARAFQRGLLAWLRGPRRAGGDAPDARRDAPARDAAARAARAVVGAGGLIDSLKDAADAEWLGAAKVVCNRVDFPDPRPRRRQRQERRRAARSAVFVARRDALTPRIKEVKQLYQLDSLFPRPERRRTSRSN